MRVIIGGAGRVGGELARALRAEDKDVVIVDNDIRSVKNTQNMDVLVLHGDVTQRAKLIESGIGDAQIFVATTDSDHKNLLACSIAKHAHNQLRKGKSELITICRVRDPVLVLEHESGDLSEWAGVDHIVDAIDSSIDRLMAGLKSPSLEHVIPFDHSAYVLELTVTQDAAVVAYNSLREAEERMEGGLPPIVGLKRSGEPGRVPNEGDRIMPKDKLALATAGESSFNRLLRLFGHEAIEFPEDPRVVIFGASLVGCRLAEAWLKSGASVTVVERDLNRANEIAGSWIGSDSKLEVIHGDHLDRQLLAEIEISEQDIAISALSDDHASIAAALLASDSGVSRTGLVLYEADLVNAVRRMGITFAVDWKRVAVDSILAKIHNELPGPYAVLGSIPDVVGICIPISERYKHSGKSLEKISLPDWCTLAFIQRMSPQGTWSTIRPSSQKVVEVGDRLTMFLPPDRVEELEKRFKV